MFILKAVISFYARLWADLDWFGVHAVHHAGITISVVAALLLVAAAIVTNRRGV